MSCHTPKRFPCGRCPGCLAKRASDWSIRLVHEHRHPAPGIEPESSFITLTFEDGNVVDVSKDCAQDFMKRLRKRLAPKRIRFYLVSEYGEKTHRPHYHAIIFGHDFRKDHGSKPVRRGLYTSPLLEAAWGLGHVSTGEVTDASIRYVTNYVLAKEDVPVVLSLETGESRRLAPVFSLMSRRPGIGSGWIDNHGAETYRDDDVLVNGFRRQPPRYYDNRSFAGDDEALKALRSARRSAKFQVMERNEVGWLRNNDPLRRKASANSWRARRALQPKGGI